MFTEMACEDGKPEMKKKYYGEIYLQGMDGLLCWEES